MLWELTVVAAVSAAVWSSVAPSAHRPHWQFVLLGVVWNLFVYLLGIGVGANLAPR